LARRYLDLTLKIAAPRPSERDLAFQVTEGVFPDRGLIQDIAEERSAGRDISIVASLQSDRGRKSRIQRPQETSVKQLRVPKQ
jgi:hypothetical protein